MSLFAPFRVPEPATSTPQQRMAFMAARTRGYGRDLAMEHLLNPPGDDRYRAEHWDACLGFGFQCRATDEEINTTAKREWDAAVAHNTRVLGELQRRLWRPCRTQMPREAILATADALCRELDVFVPEELLAPLLTKIWRAAQPGRRRPPTMGVQHGRAA